MQIPPLIATQYTCVYIYIHIYTHVVMYM